MPGGLVEALAKILPHPEDPRRLVSENFDSFFPVTYLTPAQIAIVNRAAQPLGFPQFAELGE